MIKLINRSNNYIVMNWLQAGDLVEVVGICEVLCKNRQKLLLIGFVKVSMGYSEVIVGNYLINYLIGEILIINYGYF